MLSIPSLHPVLRSLTPSLTEVDRIFDHPLEAMLDPQLLLSNEELLVGEGEDWPYGAGEVHVSYPLLSIHVFGAMPIPTRLPVMMTLRGVSLIFCSVRLHVAMQGSSLLFASPNHFSQSNLLTSQNTTDVRLDGLDGLIYRMHRFRTCASPIKGLTADILVRHICFMLSDPRTPTPPTKN